jgi:hypothetical protein
MLITLNKLQGSKSHIIPADIAGPVNNVWDLNPAKSHHDVWIAHHYQLLRLFLTSPNYYCNKWLPLF